MSEVSKALPLFRLPTILLRKINRYMDLQEILLISLASKKSAYIMRSLLPKNCFTLSLLFICNHSDIFLGSKGLWDRVKVSGQNVGDRFKLQVAQPSGDVTYLWAGSYLEDPVKLLLSHFAIVFNPTISIYFGDTCTQNFVMDLLLHLKQLNILMKDLTLSRFFISPENYKYVLDEYREVSELYLFCEVASNFEYRAGPDFRVDDFCVSDGH
ncbi:hypothetical protein CRE_04249 [Caenorhabditis remanei]|uniref:F-box domain-containing protein n=1 Tax=Caenorhabditis remanei TaxID=31234 RepID=E3MYY4_CAERE|nr:hypothetical protein CRE_04249 [Caenorhabditis remanei]